MRPAAVCGERTAGAFMDFRTDEIRVQDTIFYRIINIINIAATAMQPVCSSASIGMRWHQLPSMKSDIFRHCELLVLRLLYHGWGGNHFVPGGSVNGGKIHGSYPDDLTDASLLNAGRGRIIPTTPWEGLWQPVGEWLRL